MLVISELVCQSSLFYPFLSLYVVFALPVSPSLPGSGGSTAGHRVTEGGKQGGLHPGGSRDLGSPLEETLLDLLYVRILYFIALRASMQWISLDILTKVCADMLGFRIIGGQGVSISIGGQGVNGI